jgi:SHS family lactate transporter-like MFS transporter
MSGFLQEGYATGNLLAAICYLIVFPIWGWRVMFFIGGLPALLAIYVRMGVKESEVWEKTRAESWSHLGRAIVSHWRIFLYIFVLMTAMNCVSHGTQDMYPTFLKTFKGFTPQQASYVGMVYNVGAILGGLIVGHLSDRFGRRRAMVTSLLLAVVAIPLWAYSPTTPLLLLGAFMLQFMVQGAWGIIPAHINELSPDSVRGFLPGFAYQCGVAVGGWIVVLQDTMKDHMSYATAMAASAATVFILAAVIASVGKERRAAEFGVR